MNVRLTEQLNKSGIAYKANESLANYSTWKIGGICDIVTFPVSFAHIAELVMISNVFEVPFIVIGQGSNVLFDDKGLRGMMIHLGNNFSKIDIDGSIIRAQSGAWVPGLARLVMQHSLSGIEHTAGIPGTIGGLVVMNGGSQRKSISSHIKTVRVINREGCEITLTQKDCGFDYRKSIFQKSDYIITEVELELEPKPQAEIRKEMLSILRARRDKFPRKEPNCGSVFKSDPQLYETFGSPGKIIEDLGLMGYRIGDAEISTKHSNFIVNKGNAKAMDILTVITYITRSVYTRLHFNFKCEVQYINHAGIVSPASEVGN